MNYDNYRYLWPPRPEAKIAPAYLGQLEAMGMWGQAKMNGTNCTLYVPATSRATSPQPEASFAMGRHGPDNKLKWQPGDAWKAFTNTLAPGWHVFVGELLHSKVKGGPRDTVYLFDVLVADGEYLVGRSYRERYQRLRQMCANLGDPRIEHTHLEYAPGIWLTNNHAHSFAEWYAAPHPDFIEGLVFKQPDSKLMPCSRAGANNDGQIKCRYGKANISTASG